MQQAQMQQTQQIMQMAQKQQGLAQAQLKTVGGE